MIALVLRQPSPGSATTDILAQTRAIIGRAVSEDAKAGEKAGADERGGSSTYIVIGGERTVERRQSEVWLALRDKLAQRGVVLEKTRHARGYEVDGLIRTSRGIVLVEIKTTVAAADIYTDVGQLLLYPQLLTRMKDCERVLLLPAGAPAALLCAVEACGIEVHAYESASDGRAQEEGPHHRQGQAR